MKVILLRLRLKYIFIFFILFFFTLLFSGEVEEVDKVIIREKQEELEKKIEEDFLKSKERMEIEGREKSKYEPEFRTKEEEEEIPGKLPRFLIKKIILKNNVVISNRQRNKLLKPYLNKELDLNDIRQLTRELTNFCITKGYPTLRIKIPLEQDLKIGVLTLYFVNGFIEEFVYGKGSFFDKSKVFMAFPFTKNKILKLADIEQGIEQLNRLSSNNVIMKIIPGEKEESSKIVLKNMKRDFLKLNLDFDNIGEKTTGEIRRKISLSLDNLLFLNDNWYIYYMENNDNNKEEKYSRNYYITLSIPFGYWTFMGYYNYSKYLMNVEGLSRTFENSGNSIIQEYSLERVLFRKNANKLKFINSLTIKENETYIEDVKTLTGSKKLSIFKSKLSYKTILFSGMNNFSLSYYKGLDVFGAKKDTSGMTRDTPKSQFEKYVFSFNWNKSLSIFEHNFVYMFNLNSQYSEDELYGGEKFSAGGSANSISGIKGYNVNSEVSYYLPYIDFLGEYNNYIKRLFPSIFINYGHTRQSDNSEKKKVFDGGCKLSFYGEYFSINASYYKPFRVSSNVDKEKDAFELVLSFNINNISKKVINTSKKIFYKEEVARNIDTLADSVLVEPILEKNKKDTIIPIELDIDKDNFRISKVKNKIGIIEIKYEENLNLYSEWSKVSLEEIKELNVEFEDINKILYGSRIKIPLNNKEEFEKLRYNYHKGMEEKYWKDRKIVKIIKYKLKNNDYMWKLCEEELGLPIWLIERYNRKLDLNKVNDGQEIVLPVIEAIK